MIKLFSVKEKQKQEAASANGKGVKQSAGEIRLQKDISELNLSKGMSIKFPEGKDKLLIFEITMKPDEGIYRGGCFTFSFNISTAYPHDAPKVKCKTKVFHPNIDLDGNICLNILREDWKPVLSINSVIYGLQFLFLDPNPDDPLNKEAAEMQTNSPRQFEAQVQASILRGCSINGHYFPPCRA
ncbi:putative NEDD8-conjugating enzyme Ubc12-like [Coccomyxa viridis]|uniref:NEDD8-conjugating enzyme Ubc12-like n=1 Tax=Coccomyxa viridis TaxID=1274662 RepID=A0AAV1IJS9_9CHLO|nr:putative NEDD8-conjugating enzyme Ubc12-like [Coccomyxa viridis]